MHPQRLWLICLPLVAGMMAACQPAGEQHTSENSQREEMNMDTSRDRMEILELLNRHQIYIDLKDAERYAGVYAPDGRYESPFASARGTEELIAMSRSLEASGFTKNKRHYNGPAMIDVDGDKATALSYWWVADYTGKPTVFATGTYRDELQRIDGRWKITHRVQAQDSGESEGEGDEGRR